MAATGEVDLRPNRSLLDSKFESYRLSLEPIPVLKQDLKDGVKQHSMQGDEYGYLHVQFYGLINALWQDPWHTDTVFYISEKQQIYCVHLSQGNYLSEPSVVFSIPDREPQSVISMSFPDPHWVVVNNGCGTIYILRTADRSRGDAWKLCQTHNIDWMESGTLVLTSNIRRLPETEAELGAEVVSPPEKTSSRIDAGHLDVVMAYIANPQQVDGNVILPETTVHFVCVLEWLTFSPVQDNEKAEPVAEMTSLSWKLQRQRRLVSGSVPQYLAIDSFGCLIVASEKEFNFVFDSSAEISANNGGGQRSDSKTDNNEPPLYTYLQTSEEVTVAFKLTPDVRKSDVKVDLADDSLEIQINGTTRMKGALSSRCNSDASTWTILDSKLEVILVKSREGEVWHGVVEGDQRGEEVMDPAFIDEIHQRLQHLTSDTVANPTSEVGWDGEREEECDETTPYFSLWRLDGSTHRVKQHVNLAGHQWLFSIPRDEDNELPRLCLRHDVDGLVWQPVVTSHEQGDETFLLRHVGTFNAFGYVSASKQDRLLQIGDRKYRWATLCDAQRHVYIYRAPEVQPDLRNRKSASGATTVARQHVVNLEDCNSIRGMVACEHGVFVLSSNRLYALKLLSEPEIGLV